MSDAWSTRPLTLADDPVGPFCFRSNFLLVSLCYLFILLYFSACLSRVFWAGTLSGREWENIGARLFMRQPAGTGRNGQKEKMVVKASYFQLAASAPSDSVNVSIKSVSTLNGDGRRVACLGQKRLVFLRFRPVVNEPNNILANKWLARQHR